MHSGLKTHFLLHLLLLASVCLSSEPLRAQPVEPAPVTEAAPAAANLTVAPESEAAVLAAARLIEALREQQESNQRTIEALKEQAANARHQSEITTSRLKLIEMTLSERHERELQALQASSRLNFTVVAVVACVGLVALAVMAFFLFRATNQLADLPRALAQLSGPGGAGPTSGRFLLTGTTSAEANARLMSMVGVLEKKFGELERAVEAPAAPDPEVEPPVAETNGHGHGHGPRPAPNAEGDRLRGLLARGQKLLDNDATAEALQAFDEAVTLAPGNTDALVKRGKVLEKLGRMEEALANYNRALELDESLTIAHLSKGGVFNRLDRFGEALECYERALKTQGAPVATQVAA